MSGPRVLYVARCGSLLSGWWDECPPRIEPNTRAPKFRAPDIYHDRVSGSTEEALRTFEAAGLICQPYAVSPTQIEWAGKGVRLAVESKRRTGLYAKPDPAKGGLFSPELVAPVDRNGHPR